MKPPPFGYSRPQTLDEALSSLAALGPGAKVLAGGQSLIPLLSMRLAAPEHLVDINRLDAELGYLRTDDDAVHIGALTRHSRLLADPAAATGQPLLAQATARIAHATIRNAAPASAASCTPTHQPNCPPCWHCWAGSARLASAAVAATSPLPTSSSARSSRRCRQVNWRSRRAFRPWRHTPGRRSPRSRAAPATTRSAGSPHSCSSTRAARCSLGPRGIPVGRRDATGPGPDRCGRVRV